MHTPLLKKIAFSILLGLCLLTGLTSVQIVLAENGADQPIEESGIPTIPKPDLLPGPEESATQTEVQEYFREEAIPGFISGFLGIIAGVALLALMWSGVRFMTAYGEEEALTAAKKTATWAVLGFGISLLAYAIVGIINTLSFPEEGGEAVQEDVVYEEF